MGWDGGDDMRILRGKGPTANDRRDPTRCVPKIGFGALGGSGRVDHAPNFLIFNERSTRSGADGVPNPVFGTQGRPSHRRAWEGRCWRSESGDPPRGEVRRGPTAA